MKGIKTLKNWDFFKRVSPFFFLKKAKFFHLFILGKKGQEKVFDDILERKSACLDYKNKKLKKVEKLRFSKGVSPWFLYKKKKFFYLLILGKTGQENVLDEILERK